MLGEILAGIHEEIAGRISGGISGKFLVDSLKKKNPKRIGGRILVGIPAEFSCRIPSVIHGGILRGFLRKILLKFL